MSNSEEQINSILPVENLEIQQSCFSENPTLAEQKSTSNLQKY
jgi:hypothetical protein